MMRKQKVGAIGQMAPYKIGEQKSLSGRNEISHLLLTIIAKYFLYLF